MSLIKERHLPTGAANPGLRALGDEASFRSYLEGSVALKTPTLTQFPGGKATRNEACAESLAHRGTNQEQQRQLGVGHVVSFQYL